MAAETPKKRVGHLGFKGEKDTIKGCCFVRVEKVIKKEREDDSSVWLFGQIKENW